MREATPTKYLYIVGRGHSGSTIFSMLVGEARSVASEGEIIIGFREGYESKRCANGEIFAESPFWKDVQAAFARRTGTDFAEAVQTLYRRAHVVHVPAALLAPANSRKVTETKRLLEALYDSIAEAASRPVVLDSTKELATAIFLLRHVPDAKVVHFVRSPFGVVDSYIKRIKSNQSFEVFQRSYRVERRYFFPMVVSALLWSAESLACELLRLRYPTRLITLHYEDLCDEPIALLEKLERFTGVSLAEAKEAVRDHRAMQPRHALSGNRLMRGKEIVFSPKKGLPRFLTPFDKAVVTVCTFPMTLIYRYLGRRSTRPAVVMRELPQ